MTDNIKSEALQAEKVKLSEAQKTIVAQCWLAEFEGLRNLVLNFQRMQHNLIWVNISAVGVILATAISWNMVILLAIPFVSSLLGLYWVAQGTQTSQIGHYIRDRIAPALQTLCSSQEVMGWETHIRAEMKDRLKKRRIFQILNPLLIPRATGGLIFVIPCLVGLGLTAKELLVPDQWEIKAVWVVTLILTLVLIFFGYWSGQYWIGEKNVQPI